MSSIRNLTEATEVSSSMQLPVLDTYQGQPRSISIAQLTTYMQDNLTSDASGPFKLANYSVAELPSAMANPAAVVYCTNGNSGVACLAVSNGTNWLRVVFGAAVSA